MILAGAVAFAAVVLVLPPSRARSVLAMLLPLGVLIGVSWWWFRRERPSRRAKTIGLWMAATAVLFLVVGSMFPVTIVALLWGLPASLLLALATFLLARRAAARPLRLAVGAVFLVSLVPWPLLRADGASGQMMPNLFWVWQAPGLVEPGGLEAQSSQPVEVPTVATARDWPGFRGADRTGAVSEVAATELDLDWESRAPVEIWRRAVGRGWSSFAIVGELACTQDQAGGLERVVCLEAATGRVAWVHAEEARFDETASGPGPRATPLIDDGRLYALGATGVLNCLDAQTGERVWSVDISDGEGSAPMWGFAGSPLVVDELVYISPAGIGGIRMLALDRRTGERVWEARGEASGYGSAHLAVLEGTRHLLLFDGGGLVGFDPRTGEQLWEYAWPTPLPRVVQPAVVGDDRVIIGMGYGHGTRSLRITRSPVGWSVTELWSTSRFKPNFNDFVVSDGHVFGLNEGILVCIDASTGERLWKGGRYGHGQLLLVGGVLLVVSESGDLVIVEASTASHNELARVPALDGKSWNHPAIAGGRLFVRNGSQAACYDLRAGRWRRHDAPEV